MVVGLFTKDLRKLGVELQTVGIEDDGMESSE
jgi:hypothetical protein